MNLDRFIYYRHNVFTDNFCDTLVNLFETEAQNNRVFIGQSGAGVNHDIKQTSEIDLIPRSEANWDNFYSIINDHLSNHYLASMPMLDKFNPEMRILFNETYYEVCQIQKYDKGRGHYNAWHVEVDGPDSCIRPFSMIIYLNDVEVGGETSFLYTGTKVKPRKGSLLIFPSAFPFVHRGETPISHDKYIIATWLAYRPFVNS